MISEDPSMILYLKIIRWFASIGEASCVISECTVCVWLLQLKSVFLLAHISISELVCLYSHLIF